MPVLEEGGIRGVLSGKLPVVLQELLVQLPWDLLGRYPLKNRDVQRMPALFTLVDQPHVQLVFVGVHPEAPGADKDGLFAASAASVDDLVFLVCIARRISFVTSIRRLSQDSLFHRFAIAALCKLDRSKQTESLLSC